VLSGEDILRLLPHRYPFVLVDRVVEFEPESRILALKNVAANEPHFAGHFPGRPIMPGVLLCEALAQAGGLLVQGSHRGSLEVPEAPDGKELFLVLTGLDHVKFRRQVLPGDQVQLEVSLLRRHRPLWKMRGVARVGEQVVAQADFSAAEVPPEGLGRRDWTSGGAPAGVVHPTAIVSPGAELGPGVEVGAYAFIGPNVRIGAGSRIEHHASIDGHTILGEENRVSPFAVLGSTPQDMKYEGEDSRLVLGDRNHVREFATLELGTAGGGMETRVGSDNLFMHHSHVGHDCRVGNRVVMVNSSALAGHVQLDDYVIVSGLAAVAQFVRVGESAFLGGGSMVVMDVPPYCTANGNRAELKGLNTVGLQRRGLSPEGIREVKRAYRTLFLSKLRTPEAVAKVRLEASDSPEALRLAEFVESSERGVTRP
jgi:UDP-N-acetylglucosamine acyltransferase